MPRAWRFVKVKQATNKSLISVIEKKEESLSARMFLLLKGRLHSKFLLSVTRRLHSRRDTLHQLALAVDKVVTLALLPFKLELGKV